MDEREDIRAIAVAASVSEPTIVQSSKTEADVLFKSDNFSTAPLSKTNKGNENIIDSKNLPRKIKDLMKMIKQFRMANAFTNNQKNISIDLWYNKFRGKKYILNKIKENLIN